MQHTRLPIRMLWLSHAAFHITELPVIRGKPRPNMASQRNFDKRLADILPRLESLAYFVTGSRDLASDLVQDTCERAWSRRAQWSGTSFDSWMFSILRSRWQDQIRRQKPSLDNIDPNYNGEHVSDSRAAAQIEAALRRPDLDKVWKQLSQDQREVVGMVHILGHTYAEAAEILNIPIGTVMSRLHRAHRIAARSGKQRT